MNLSKAFAEYLPWIEAEMRDILTAPAPVVARNYDIMQYHMGWRDTGLHPIEAAGGGKRIRPMLCLLACAAVGGDPQTAVPAAAGLELLHNFSLLHDDIEDNSDTRRHRPTAWTLFGLPLALNAGDAMFSLAHLAFQRLTGRGAAAETALAALGVFDETCRALTDGQYLDMSFETRLDVTVEEYFAMIDGKTAALLAAAPGIGALLGGAAPETVRAYRRFGRAMGLAFQLQDDVLGIWGDEAQTGKSAASDILTRKKSLPVVYALADEWVGADLRRLYEGPGFTPADVPAVLTLLDAARARDYTEARAADALAEARHALAEATLVASGAPDLLIELLDSLVNRRS
jgi:geranylgeranyl diphosphate synthase, type I